MKSQSFKFLEEHIGEIGIGIREQYVGVYLICCEKPCSDCNIKFECDKEFGEIDGPTFTEEEVEEFKEKFPEFFI